MRYQRRQSDNRKKHVHLAVGNLGDDEIAGQDGKVHAVADDLVDAGTVRVCNCPKFQGDENGWH